ncbi:MAG TPA: hypothetical protein VFN31_00700 [Candidatus Saccharimonadales bacterium]|nr:hypothetical protein [Candidatus Saccharimonadales bacterium]
MSTAGETLVINSDENTQDYEVPQSIGKISVLEALAEDSIAISVDMSNRSTNFGNPPADPDDQ